MKTVRKKDSAAVQFFSGGSWKKIRPFFVLLLALLIVGAAILAGINYVSVNFLQPLDADSTEVIEVEIRNGLGKSGIANVLNGEGDSERVISNSLSFRLYVDFVGKGNKLRAGLYELSPSMTVPEIVNKLVSGDGSVQVVKQFTIVEGATVEDIAETLFDAEIIPTKEEFLQIAEDGNGFEAITSDMKDKANRLYVLEGYLYPETYKVFQGASARSIIELMTNQFSSQITSSDIERAEVLEMSIDEIITLASIIEKEAKTEDFAKVSAVFHNRLSDEMMLESDATVKYGIGASEMFLSRTQLQSNTPYSTHTKKGLPIGAICNPGRNAINAALWPDEKYIDGKYLYFTLTDPAKGELEFSKNYEEHAAIVEKYRDLWIDFDKQNASQDKKESGGGNNGQ